ncbi:MAG: hypothetical protein K0S65_2405 [Labilithrix sp.]|nr:hypothetical protein [Labilithrix sp.]
MIAADNADDLLRREETCNLPLDVLVDLLRERVDAAECSDQLGIVAGAALLDHLLGDRLPLLVPGGHLRRYREHVDPLLVRTLDVEVEKVDLLARLEDGARPLGRPAAIRCRRLPRDGDEHDESLGFGVR